MKKMSLMLATGCLLTANAAVAQNPPTQAPTRPPVPQSQPQVEMSDAKVEKFAEVYVAVETTRSRIAQELSSVEDQQEAQEIQMKMRDEIIATIEDHGWNLAEYNQAAKAISRNEELKQKALEKINEISG